MFEEAEHDPADRGSGVHAVGAQRRPLLVGVDALVLQVGIDEVDERLSVQLESMHRVGQCDQDRVGALVVLEALTRLVAPATETAHRDRAVTALVAEVIGEPAERVDPREVATQSAR